MHGLVRVESLMALSHSRADTSLRIDQKGHFKKEKENPLIV